MENFQQALTATFKQRNTPLPIETPLALTAAFFDDPLKQTQWKAFLRKGRLDDSGVLLREVAHELSAFLLPAASAAAANTSFIKTWLFDGKWR